MSKAKTAGEKATATAESALENGADALKTGLEKALKGYDAVLGYGKDTAEAVMQVRHRRRQGHRDASTAKSIPIPSSRSKTPSPPPRPCMGSKSVHEAFEFQTDFAKSAFEAYVGELSKFGELVTATTKDTFAPLQGPRSGLAGRRCRPPAPPNSATQSYWQRAPASPPGPFCFSRPGRQPFALQCTQRVCMAQGIDGFLEFPRHGNQIGVSH